MPSTPAPPGARSFSRDDNRTFWAGNAASYQGEENAGLQVFLTRPFLGRRILDAGAGDGSLVRCLRARFPRAEVIGIDLAPKHADVDEGDLTSLSCADGQFDTVFCSEVIEHVSPADTARILEELARVLVPGGVLVLTTPYAERLDESLVTCPGCRTSFHRWGHQQTFVEDDFERLARTHGFEPLVVMPVRYSRVRRLRFLGGRILRSAYMRRRMQRARGRRSLLMVARKRGRRGEG